MAVENVNDKLNPKLWKKEELKPEVKEKLFAIAENFISNIKEDEIDLKMKDLVIVGSNANFNYNDTSDIDLHIIADMSETDEEEKKLLCILYNAYKALFNNKYDIIVKGHEVEIYVEPDEPAVQSGGIYSLLNGWIKKPSREVFVASDEETEEFEKQFKEWEDRYKEIIEGEDIPEKGIEEALIHPEHYNKKVEIIVGNALSREIERRFGSDIIEKEIKEKNSIRYVIPYDQRLEHFIKQFNRTYKIVESVESGADAKISKIDAFLKDFYELRKSALKTGSENSIGNKIFKQFRKLGYLKTLKDLKTAFEEKQMSLEKLETSNEELKEDIKMITDEELFWHLRDGLVNKKGDYINKTKYSERAKEVLDIFEGNIYVNSSGELDLYPNSDNMFAVSPEQYPKHLLNRDSLLKFKDAVKGEIVMFYNSTDEYGSEYSVLTSHEDLAIKACKGELGKEFAKQRAYAKYVDGEYQEVEINKNMLVSESANKLYNKNKGEYKNMKTMKEIKSMKITESVEIFDILGIDEENRESSKHLISQYKELQKKFPQASIWLNGDVDVYVKGKVLGKTADLSAVEERAVEEGGHGSGNFKSGAQRYNDKKDKIFSRYNAEQERFAKFLLDHEVSAEEVEKLKQDSGLHGNPLAKKYFELKKQLEEKVVEPELPTEVTIDGELLVDDIDDIGEAYLDEVISDWLSDEYGVVHLGFDYDIVGTDVHVFNILWDTSDEYSLEESIKLNEGTANFGTNDIINLCSPYVDPDGYRDYADELREEEPDITEEEIAQRISEVVDNDYTDMYEQVNSYLEEVDDYVIVEPGYYKGFYIKFKFNDGLELAENWFYYDKEYALQEFKNTVEKIKQGLKKSVEQDQLVEYSVAYRASNGETGYNLIKEKEQTLKKIEETMNKILKEGLEAIEEEFIDEI